MTREEEARRALREAVKDRRAQEAKWKQVEEQSAKARWHLQENHLSELFRNVMKGN